MRPLVASLLAVSAVACRPAAHPDPPGSFAFAVFGDAPYTERQEGRVDELIEAVNADSLAFFLHVGDLFEYPCSDSLLRARFELLQRIRIPVIYTPGDNEWTDCWRPRSGGYAPLERLARVRRLFFPKPDQSLGGTPMPVTSQGRDVVYAEFLENVRWTYGGVVFATVHLVGSRNGGAAFPRRTVIEDREVVRRLAAAIDWMRRAFDEARETGARAVVIACHADPRFHLSPAQRDAFDPFLRTLELEAQAFARPILFIHGDTHLQRVDRPLADRETGEPLDHVIRLETFGSPTVGWVRVVVDTSSPEVFRFDPRR